MTPLSDFPPAMTPAREQLPPLDDFISEEAVNEMVSRGLATRQGAVLRLNDGRRFALEHALRILGNISHETDPYGFTGTTDTLRALLARGFVLTAERVALGRAVYDVAFGYIAHPFADPDASGVNPVIR